MENRFNIDELEQFLSEEVEQCRMYPSEKVWENIRTELHGNSSWPALTFIAISLIIALTVSTLYNYPPKSILLKKEINNHLLLADRITNAETNSNPANRFDIQIHPDSYSQKIFNNSITASAAPRTTEIVKRVTSSKIAKFSPPVFKPISKHENHFVAPEEITATPVNTSFNSSNALITENNLNKVFTYGEALDAVLNTGYDKEPSALSISTFSNANINEKPTKENLFTEFTHQQLHRKLAGWNRWGWDLYITPSVSYRKLEDDKQRVLYSGPATAASNSITANIDNAVRHKPALGMEAGIGLTYQLTQHITLKTGLQFNIRQYYIDAYQQFGIATISYVRNNQLDSVRMITPFSNSNGYATTKLDNKLYQFSIPLGVQWTFFQGKRLGLNAGVSVQPTFTLNKNIYMISTDYKYYANGASFFRKWNVNTGLELNVTYQTKNATWFAGPQIRFQHLPTYNDLYPIKEYRWDYGLKIGILRPLHK
ncbi:MAG: outer membrane beta-barrel protein [Bacteroidota bacterium]|nr:outer membrane beta-barrel protein [Bacteroidota bacterium]